ncbi:macro domain-containing protein [Geomonas agri]|uniref:ADP-ribose-binding protein n=1 Tax=Geomonas agri TaxID=2873702 RepID=UPI001CD2343F|nr:ADP-ribose-binding protein [Geomonas agri]
MREIEGDIWNYFGKGVIAITTNGHVTRNGTGVVGNGVARQALERFPDLQLRLGEILRTSGNHVASLGDNLVSFPVEDSPWALPDLRLIRRSAEELRRLADHEGWQLIIVPRPGCGGGGLSWREVRPLLTDLFDDRFLVITEKAITTTVETDSANL